VRFVLNDDRSPIKSTRHYGAPASGRAAEQLLYDKEVGG
jgi:hypothetical protein